MANSIDSIQYIQQVVHLSDILVINSPPSAAYMCQWIWVSIGSDNGMVPIRHQAII